MSVFVLISLFSIVMFFIGLINPEFTLIFLPPIRRTRIVSSVIWVLIFIISTCNIGATSNKKFVVSQQDSMDQVKTKNDNLIYYAEVFSVMAVEQSLKCPSTVHTHPLEKPVQYGDNFICSGYVDAENSYGAHIRSKYKVKISYVGGDESNSDNWNFKIIELH